MRWILWLLSGIALAVVILVAASALLLARLNPWLARRVATSRFAGAVLLLIFDVAAFSVHKSRS